MAQDDITIGRVIKGIFNLIEKLCERSKQRTEARIERKEQERERIQNAFFRMAEKTANISSAAHQLEYPYDSVTNNLTSVVHWLLEEARTGAAYRKRRPDEVQYIIGKLNRVAHLIGCELVKKERTTA